MAPLVRRREGRIALSDLGERYRYAWLPPDPHRAMVLVHGYAESPDLQMEFLKVFDGPNPVECYQRTASVVPQQALALANSQLSQEMAAKLAARLEGPALVERAFVTVLGRKPSAGELALARQATPANLVHALFNHPDFVTIR